MSDDVRAAAERCRGFADPGWVYLDEMSVGCRADLLTLARAYLAPIDMVLPCPRCGLVHIDAPEPEPECNCRVPEYEGAGQHATTCAVFREVWTNPPHKSHLCHGCGLVWRPADVATNGVAATRTRGEKDGALDDGEPVTAEWMGAVIPGFALTSNVRVGGCQHAGWRVMAHKTGEEWALIARTARGEASLSCSARGDVRRLCRALGVPLTEAA